MPIPKFLVAGGLALLLAGCGAEQAVPSAPPSSPVFDTVQTVSLSATEHDRLLTAAFDAGNRLYAAGFVAEGADQRMAVVRFDAAGARDGTFGTGGVASVNVAPGGKAVELARSLVVQGTGKVVVAGPVEKDDATGVALARFDDRGVLDPAFGTAGVVRLDLSTVWGLVRLSGERLLVVGGRAGDFAVVRLTADGATDGGFGNGGVAQVGAPDVSEVPKTAVELPDGKVVVAGYGNVNGVVSPILFRLTPAGQLDPAFGEGGVAVRPVLGNVGEAYSVVLAGSRFVTTGYGKDTAEAKVDLIANGFTLDGALDRSFGTNGTSRVDIAGEDDRGRNLVALPDGRTIAVGSGKPSRSNLDGMVVRLSTTGAPDRKLFDVGGPNDSFFGVALSPDGTRVAVVGYLGRDASGSEKDDSAVLWLQP